MVIDLRLIYQMCTDMCYKCVYAVVDAVNQVITITFPMEDTEKLTVLSGEFAMMARNPQAWLGQVLAVDGVHFAQKNPGKAVPNPVRYYVNRKDEFALLCIAGCDSQRRFLCYDIDQVPTTHDSLAWALSPVGARVNAGELPYPFFVNGDSAFVLSNSMIVPSGIRELDDFDFEQSSNRMPIECAFGILVRRWGLLWRPLSMRFDRRAPIIGALLRLHNFCIDKRIADETRDVNGISEITPDRWALTPKFDKSGRPVEYLRTLGSQTRAEPGAPVGSSERSRRRDELAAGIKEAGLGRPPINRRTRI